MTNKSYLLRMQMKQTGSNMINYLILIVVFVLNLHLCAVDEPEQSVANPTLSLAGFSALPSTLVNDCVSVITGEYIDIQTDVSLA